MKIFLSIIVFVLLNFYGIAFLNRRLDVVNFFIASLSFNLYSLINVIMVIGVLRLS
ncbi:MAG: hypothetical protein ACI863_001029 [Flavobacteriales bacterium]|jgi:hypothetical protein